MRTRYGLILALSSFLAGLFVGYAFHLSFSHLDRALETDDLKSEIEQLKTQLAGGKSASPDAETAQNSDKLIVYVIPLQIETIRPVTRDTVACDARERWTLPRQGEGTRFLGLFTESGEGVFTEERTRLKIIDGDETYYVDADGFASKGKGHLRIDPNAFRAFAQSVSSNERRVNVRMAFCGNINSQ